MHLPVLVSKSLKSAFICLGGVVKEFYLFQLCFCDYLDIHLHFNRYGILL